jgi:deoxyribonuclease-4
VARILADVDDTPEAARLVLENSSGSGFGLGTSVTELADIAEAIAARGVAERRVGFCLDTAHAWGAGVDLSTPDGVDGFLAAFDERLGLD